MPEQDICIHPAVASRCHLPFSNFLSHRIHGFEKAGLRSPGICSMVAVKTSREPNTKLQSFHYTTELYLFVYKAYGKTKFQIKFGHNLNIPPKKKKSGSFLFVDEQPEESKKCNHIEAKSYICN